MGKKKVKKVGKKKRQRKKKGKVGKRMIIHPEQNFWRRPLKFEYV